MQVYTIYLSVDILLTNSWSLEVGDACGDGQAWNGGLFLSGTVNQAERPLAMAEKGFELGVKIRLEVEDAELNQARVTGMLGEGNPGE